MKRATARRALGLALLACWAAACARDRAPQPAAGAALGANEELAAHSDEFKREVVKVTDGVYVAVGFGLANSILIS